MAKSLNSSVELKREPDSEVSFNLSNKTIHSGLEQGETCMASRRLVIGLKLMTIFLLLCDRWTIFSPHKFEGMGCSVLAGILIFFMADSPI
jgi:hypothetical protein